jgi:hypothetical protein
MHKSITPLSAISTLMIFMASASLLPDASQAQTPQMVLVAAAATMAQHPTTSSWGSPPINFAVSVKVSLLKTDPIPAPRGSDAVSSARPVGLRIPDSQPRNPDILVRN